MENFAKILFFLKAFSDVCNEQATFPADEKSWYCISKKGKVVVMDSETKEEVNLMHVSRDRFITNRNLLYTLMADGPL